MGLLRVLGLGSGLLGAGVADGFRDGLRGDALREEVTREALAEGYLAMDGFPAA